MIDVRKFSSLGHADHGWLNARHHFSFADYHDPARMGWGAIRVWNDDEIAAKSGFPPHPHRDMEIITYVREGAITHQDSLGNKGRTGAGDVQVMRRRHRRPPREYNLEDERTTTLFQIWVLTDQQARSRAGARPSSRRRPLGQVRHAGERLCEDDDALKINSAARVMGATLKAGETAELTLDPARHAYWSGSTARFWSTAKRAEPRDGVAITGEAVLTIEAVDDAEIVLVDAR